MGLQGIKSLVGKNPAVIAPVLTALFESLDREDVLWAVMRGWEGLPDFTRYDVDILVARRDIRRAVRIAGDVARRLGWIPYGYFRFERLRSVWILLQGQEEVSYLRLDFMTGVAFRGVDIIDSGKWLARRTKTENGIWRVENSYAGCCVLLKELAAHGQVDGEHRRRQIGAALAASESECREILADSLRCLVLAERVLDTVRREDWESLAGLAGDVKRRLFLFRLSHAWGRLAYVIDVARLQMFPFMRLFIAFIGPDGCGKTTVADAVVAGFKNRPFTNLFRIHMIFGLFPRLRDIRRFLLKCVGIHVKVEEAAAPGTRHIGMQRPLSGGRTMAYVLYYSLEMCLGRVRLMFWRAFSGIVLADRYFFDYYYMRGYMNCPKWFLDAVSVIVPKPDLVFVLERPAEEIYAQKPELEVGEIRRQQQAIRAALSGKRYTRIIDASQGVDETIRRVSREIEAWLVRQAPE